MEILRVLQMTKCVHNGSYLGVPFCKTIPKATTFSNLIDRVNRKLAAWKLRSLSFDGRGMLIKSAAQTIPAYTMQTYLISKSICSEIDKEKERGTYLKAWSEVCLPKEAGGLGLRRMGDINIAFITKLICLLNTQPNILWLKFFDQNIAEVLIF